MIKFRTKKGFAQHKSFCWNNSVSVWWDLVKKRFMSKILLPGLDAQKYRYKTRAFARWRGALTSKIATSGRVYSEIWGMTGSPESLETSLTVKGNETFGLKTPRLLKFVRRLVEDSARGVCLFVTLWCFWEETARVIRTLWTKKLDTSTIIMKAQKVSCRHEMLGICCYYLSCVERTLCSWVLELFGIEPLILMNAIAHFSVLKFKLAWF